MGKSDCPIVGFVSGNQEEKRKQWEQITEWCRDVGKPLGEEYNAGIYDLLLGLKRGNTVIVTSYSKLSGKADELASILYAGARNGISFISMDYGIPFPSSDDKSGNAVDILGIFAHLGKVW